MRPDDQAAKNRGQPLAGETVNKLELMIFVSETGTTTSREVAVEFEISLQQASAYLSKNHGRGYLWRAKDGRGYLYGLAMAGARNLGYWLGRVADEADGGHVPEDRPSDPPAPALVNVWCSACRKGFLLAQEQVGVVACSCGRDFVEVDAGA